jgi:preprotein translocase subunit SecG
MSGLLLVFLVALIFVVLYQVARSSEMVARIQGEEVFDKKRNKILAFSMLVLMVAFLIGIYCLSSIYDASHGSSSCIRSW